MTLVFLHVCVRHQGVLKFEKFLLTLVLALAVTSDFYEFLKRTQFLGPFFKIKSLSVFKPVLVVMKG